MGNRLHIDSFVVYTISTRFTTVLPISQRFHRFHNPIVQGYIKMHATVRT